MYRYVAEAERAAVTEWITAAAASAAAAAAAGPSSASAAERKSGGGNEWLDPAWSRMLPDPYLQLFVARFVMCRAALALHRPTAGLLHVVDPINPVDP